MARCAVCPHCGSISKDHYALQGKAHRPGLWKCKDCRQQFSVTVGTVFEHSKIGLSKWLTATFLMCSSKKGISAHQIHRTLGVTYKTAWFMAHRIRLAMDQPEGVFGSGGRIVEADEAYIGKVEGQAALIMLVLLRRSVAHLQHGLIGTTYTPIGSAIITMPSERVVDGDPQRQTAYAADVAA